MPALCVVQGAAHGRAPCQLDPLPGEKHHQLDGDAGSDPRNEDRRMLRLPIVAVLRTGGPSTDTAPSTEDDEGDDEFLGKVRSAYEQDVEAVKTCIKGVVARVGAPHAPSRGRRLAAGLLGIRAIIGLMRQCGRAAARLTPT